MYRGQRTLRTGYFDRALGRLDLSEIPAEQQPLARLFAHTLGTTLLELTSRFVAGHLDLDAHAAALGRVAEMGERLVALPAPVLASFLLDLFERLRELIGSLFDDEGVAIAVGTVEPPAAAAGWGGIGLEIDVGHRDGRALSPAELSRLPLDFDAPPREPTVRLRVLGTVDRRALDGLPSAFDLFLPGVLPRDPGVFVGVELQF